MASQSLSISIKLLIDQESNVVLLAEAGNDFVDTLHSLLKLPLGNIARLADKHQSLQPGCLYNLYNSVNNLGLKSFRTEACKQMPLYPRNVHDVEFKKLKLNMDLTVPTGHFVCGNQHCNEKEGGLFSYYDTQRCSCGKLMNVRATTLQKCDAIKDETDEVLYMEEAMFFVTDDLRVMQGFPGDLFQFLLNLGFKNASRIDEKVVQIGSKQMTDLLIHSLFSKTTLADVFLRNHGIVSCAPMLDERSSFIAPNVNETAEKDVKTRVKMMLRKSDRKVLYAEASEKFVDLLFTFLTIPLDSVLELVLGANGNLTLGSISNLFRDLNTIFSISNQQNSQLGVLPPFYSCANEFPNIRSRDPPQFYYRYTFIHHRCPRRSREARVVNKPLDPKSPMLITTNSSGYVAKNTFVVTDDLVVNPLSSFSSISLLKGTETSFDDVEQKVISIGGVEAIALLGACLWSSSALSASLNFFAKKPKQEPL
ncbi:hypothetical protein V6N13_027283 [Hibiscus sabdariffa]|uniref:DUF674 family protein n=1 Tax=Hibiscus sabdariffa TaxID=183260 RepID=A0ABR2AT15_9ROSI